MNSVLSKERIEKLIKENPPLIESYRNLNEQLQPNGFDLTLKQLALYNSTGRLTVENSRRVLSETAPLVFDGSGFIDLMPGVYLITYNEVVNLPKDVMAIAAPRSSLLRCGATVNTAIWDAGYSGRSQSQLVVYHPQGIRLQQNARITQLVFLMLDGKTEGYQGIYQGENTD